MNIPLFTIWGKITLQATLTLLAASLQANQPNILFILADDLGIGEITPFGQTEIETPRLARFAAEA